MSERIWTSCSWGDLAILEYGKALRDYRDGSGDSRVYGTNGPIGWTDGAQGSGPTVVVGRKGAYRGVHYSPGPFWVIDTAYWLRPTAKIDMRWAYYQLLTQDINARDSGSAIPSLSRSDFATLEVDLPPLAEQRAIAAVLGALDDEIEANRENELRAHELIGALFKRLMMQQPDSEVGLMEAVRFVYGEPFNSSYFNSERLGRPLIRIRDLKTFAPQTYTTEERDRETIVAPGSVVVGMDAEFRPTIWCGEPGLLNQRVCLALPLVGSPAFTYMLLGEPLAHVESFKTGTTVSHLNKADLEQIRVTIPVPAALCKFDRMAEPLREMIVASHQENRTLADLRDTLLPKLMSGELRVRDAERLVEDAV